MSLENLMSIFAMKVGKLLRKMRSLFFIAVSPCLRLLEFPFIYFYGRQRVRFDPVFIIGAPRTGSTILYQSISNHFDVLYIDNFSSFFYRNLFFGFLISRVFFGRREHGNFEADHGDTSLYGLHAPSECGDFWYRFIPRNQHYVSPSEVTVKAVDSIRREISALINFYNKPIVINNNNAGLRLALINKAFPCARFIVTDREPLYVAQSLLKARNHFYGDVTKWWSMKPENYSELLKLSPCSQVVHQHHSIRKAIIDGLRGSEDRVLWVNYAGLGFFIEPNMSRVQEFLPYLTSKGGAVPAVSVNNRVDLSSDVVEEISSSIKELHWDDCPR